MASYGYKHSAPTVAPRTRVTNADRSKSNVSSKAAAAPNKHGQATSVMTSTALGFVTRQRQSIKQRPDSQQQHQQQHTGDDQHNASVWARKALTSPDGCEGDTPGAGGGTTGVQSAAASTDASLIRFNVGGHKYMMRAMTLHNRCASSLLGRLAHAGSHDERLRYADAYIDDTNEYFFNRTAGSFDCIYRFYCTGALHRPIGVCVQKLSVGNFPVPSAQEYLDELDYWQIPDECTAQCCLLAAQVPDEEEETVDLFEGVKYASVRRRLWNIFEGDQTLPSNIFIFVSNLWVLISITALVLSSLPDFQVPTHNVKQDNGTTVISGQMQPSPVFEYIEYVCVFWFTIEYVARLAVAPAKCAFVQSFLNVVDVLAVAPFYFDTLLYFAGVSADSLEDVKGAFLVIRVLRVLRVMRVLKFGRYSSGLRTFASTVMRSARQLGMMMVVMAIGILFFATVMYYCEKSDESGQTPFVDIPTGFWFCIVTMTTVGYGDMVPVTACSSFLGKLIASCTILSGVLVIALPITVIVDNYMKEQGKTFSM